MIVHACALNTTPLSTCHYLHMCVSLHTIVGLLGTSTFFIVRHGLIINKG